MGSIRGKFLSILGLAIAVLVAPSYATARVGYGECKVTVMNDPGGRDLVGKSRDRCGRACGAAIRRCMARAGRFD
jgi:hypothetical protein